MLIQQSQQDHRYMTAETSSGGRTFKTTTNLTIILCEIYHYVCCNAFQSWLRFISLVVYF